MSLATRFEKSNDPEFRGRVLIALTQQAAAIHDPNAFESTVATDAEKLFSLGVIQNPAAYEDRAVLACVVNATIGATIDVGGDPPDGDLTYVCGQVIKTLAWRPPPPPVVPPVTV